jgi:hypothetical protein
MGLLMEPANESLKRDAVKKTPRPLAFRYPENEYQIHISA